MRRIIFIFCCILCFNFLHAQDKVDVLYLQNGEIIKGKITAHNDSITRIETGCGNIFIFHASEISSMDQEEKSQLKIKRKERGYMNYTSMGILIGSVANEKQAPLSILSEHNYRIDDNFAAGITLGYEFLNESTIPLGANMKLLLPIGTSELFIGITGGYNFSVENPSPGYYSSYTGGALFNSELGINIPLSQNNAVFFALGYRYNELHYQLDWWYQGSTERTYYYNRISIRLGVVLY